MRCHGDGIEARHQRARPEQHDGDPGKVAFFLRDDDLGARRGDEALEAATRELVGRERALFERNQRIEIAALGFADADVRERRAGELGRHGGTAQHISFMLPPHARGPPPVLVILGAASVASGARNP